MRLQAYEVVYQTMEKGEHSDSVFHRIVEQNDFLTRDKRFLKRLSYGTIERSVELDAILNQFAKIQVLKMTAPVRTVLRMALYEIRYMEKVPEAVSCHEAVELLKKKEGQKHTAFVNGVLRTILRNGDSISLKPWESLSLDVYKRQVSHVRTHVPPPQLPLLNCCHTQNPKARSASFSDYNGPSDFH